MKNVFQHCCEDVTEDFNSSGFSMCKYKVKLIKWSFFFFLTRAFYCPLYMGEYPFSGNSKIHLQTGDRL